MQRPVRRLYTWVEGSFRFEAEMLPPDDRINVRLDLENLIIEGSRQLREWEQLQDEIPSLEMALKVYRSTAKECKFERGRMASCFVYQSEEHDEADCQRQQDE